MRLWMQNCGVSRLPLDFKEQYFGCEIEMTGLSRAAAAQTLADLFGTHVEHSGGGYDAYINLGKLAAYYNNKTEQSE